MNTKDSVKNEIARILGVSPDEIRVSNPDYANLMREGVTIAPHVSYWRGKTRLDWEKLGLWFEDSAEKQALDEIISLGQLYLLPVEDVKALGTLETKIRMLPKKYGVETLFGIFIPVTRYADYKAEADQLEAEFYALRDQIDQNWHSKMEEVENNLKRAARFAWRNKAGDPAGLEEYLTERRFVEKMVKSALALIPGKKTVYDSFSLSFELRYVPLPDILAAEVAQAEIERARAEAEKETLWAERQTSQERERMIRQMNSDMVSQSRAKAQEMMDDFFLKLVSEGRQLANEVYTEVAQSLQKNGKVHGRSIVSLRNLVTQVTKLATFYNGDSDLDTLLKPARDILDALPEQRIARVDDYLASMTEVKNLAKTQLAALGLSPRAAGHGLDVTPLKPENLEKRGKRGQIAPALTDDLNIKKRGKRTLNKTLAE